MPSLRNYSCRTSSVGMWRVVAAILLAIGCTSPTTVFTEAVAKPFSVVPATKRRSSTTNARAPAAAAAASSPSSSDLYLWGNFGHTPEPLPLSAKIETSLRNLVSSALVSLDWQGRKQRFVESLTPSGIVKSAARCIRGYVFWYFSKDCLSSIYEDRWHAERDTEAFFGNEGMWVSKGAHKDVVRKRIQRSKRNRQWVGLGYTPRLVWLVGVLLRGTFQCTAIPKVFNPSLTGWGAGTILGAKCTHQEWIATFMVGWFGSEYYWRLLFGCNGPPFPKPGFVGVPVFITKLRIL